MNSESLIASLGARLKPAESALTDAAVALLGRGPVSSVELVGQVCQAIGIRQALAEQLARSILGHRPDVRQGVDGRWRLIGTSDPAATGTPTLRPSPTGPVVGPVPAEATTETLAHLPVSSLRFAVVDVETTGGRPTHGDRITEIAIVTVRDGQISEVFETLVNPERSIPPMITQITRITTQMVQDKPVFGAIADEVVRHLEGKIFVAHNASFDWRFVAHEVFRGTGRTLDGASLCTVRLARKILPQLPRRNLDAVARHYAVDIPSHVRHRAAGDAIATAKVLLNLIRDAGDRDVTTWGALDALQRGGSAGVRKKKSSRAFPAPVRQADDGA